MRDASRTIKESKNDIKIIKNPLEGNAKFTGYSPMETTHYGATTIWAQTAVVGGMSPPTNVSFPSVYQAGSPSPGKSTTGGPTELTSPEDRALIIKITNKATSEHLYSWTHSFVLSHVNQTSSKTPRARISRPSQRRG